MTKGIKDVVLSDKGLVVAIRNSKHGYAKTHGGDVFVADTGIAIATKKLRIKELRAGITRTKEEVNAYKNAIDFYQRELAKREDKLAKMTVHKDVIVEELHGILNGLVQN
jgi:hypothetical protein